MSVDSAKMSVEVVAHGQKLTEGFLDELFVSIRDKIPERMWIEVTKNHDLVIAGIKYLIDEGMYGESFEVVFNPSYTHFKKREVNTKHRSVYEGKFMSSFSDSFWKDQDEMARKQKLEAIEKESRKQELKSRKRGRRR